MAEQQDSRTVPSNNRLIKYLLIAGGSIAVILGVIGIFLPVLPTTPFLLLAAACYARSSQRFYNWLITNRYCGKYIRNYREGNGISLRHKITVISILWLTIGATCIWGITLLWLRILLIIIAAGVTAHLLRIKTMTKTIEQDSSSDTS